MIRTNGAGWSERGGPDDARGRRGMIRAALEALCQEIGCPTTGREAVAMQSLSILPHCIAAEGQAPTAIEALGVLSRTPGPPTDQACTAVGRSILFCCNHSYQ